MRALLRDLRAFAMEHERCGELGGGVEGDRVWMMCTCGANILRLVPDAQGVRTDGPNKKAQHPG